VRRDRDISHRIHSDDFSQNPYAAAFIQRATGRLEADPRPLQGALESWERLGAGFERAVTLTMLPGRSMEGLDILAELGCSSPYVPPGSPPRGFSEFEL
jgi:hypothetical protein